MEKTMRHTVYTGSQAQWESTDVILMKGEIGLATDTNIFKYGNGVNRWIDLARPVPTALADLTSDVTHRLVSDTEKATWNAKVEASAIANFITKAVSDLTNYYTKAYIDGKISDINTAISTIPKFAISVVTELPTTDISVSTLYLLKTSTTESNNLYTEYIYVDGKWESLGTQKLDLTGYATEAWVNTQLSDYVKTSALSTIAASGNLSDATQSTNFRTVTDAEKATWNNKQNALTFDTTPTASSSNPVTSGGVKTALDTKVDKVSGKGLSTNDYTSTEKSKLSGIEAGAQVNAVTSVAGKTGAVTLVKGDVGLGNVDNTSDANKPVSTATQTALNLKADKTSIITTSTGLTDTADLVRYTDTIVINGGEL